MNELKPCSILSIEGAHFRQAADRRVPSGMEASETEMMKAAVDAVDDHIGLTIELVVEPPFNDLADDRRCKAIAFDDETGRVSFRFSHCPMQGLDDVAAKGEFS